MILRSRPDTQEPLGKGRAGERGSDRFERGVRQREAAHVRRQPIAAQRMLEDWVFSVLE